LALHLVSSPTSRFFPKTQIERIEKCSLRTIRLHDAARTEFEPAPDLPSLPGPPRHQTEQAHEDLRQRAILTPMPDRSDG
jgi:hypothetical protein